MPSLKPPSIELASTEQTGLEQLVNKHSTRQQTALRARIVLQAATGQNNAEVARALGIVGCRAVVAPSLAEFAVDRADRSECGRATGRPAPALLTADQFCRMEQLVCEKPEKGGRPISQWTSRELADELIRRGVVATISPPTCRALAKKGISNRI